MISYDFEYHKPETYQEAIELFKKKTDEGKKPIYYSGGTEVVTFARKKTVKTGAVIDLKLIEETNVFSEEGENYIYGSSLTLNTIVENTKFNLLKNTIKKIADHTVRNRITIGGNICGRLFYREAILPIMVADGLLVIAGEEGIRKEKVADIFDKRLLLKPGEILLQIEVKKETVSYPSMAIRKVRYGEIDYPLLHIAALKDENGIRYSFSGICPFPFRDEEMEKILNDDSLEKTDKAKEVVKMLPSIVVDDTSGSKEYREYLLENSLIEIIDEMEGEF